MINIETPNGRDNIGIILLSIENMFFNILFIIDEGMDKSDVSVILNNLFLILTNKTSGNNKVLK